MNIFNKNPINIKKSVYSMATTDGISAEIVLYGDVYEKRPTKWTGEPVEGDFICWDEFREDLEKIEHCKNITIRMNSYGGDAVAGICIHNKIRELIRGKKKIECIVDGVAMSAGSVIISACDTVKVNPTSIIMVHRAWQFMFGGYNAEELRKEADTMDSYDHAIMEAYRRKSGLSEEEILGLMSDTTYMTGREAVEKGFADEVIEDAEPVNIAASADGRCLIVHGRTMHLAPGMFAPDSIPTIAPEAASAMPKSAPVDNKTTPAVTGRKQEGGIPTMTLEELRNQYPDLVAEAEAAAVAAAQNPDAVNAAVQSERNRLAAIDEIAALYDPAMVRDAKYGDNACDAKELTYRAAMAAAKAGKSFIAAAEDDAEKSGANVVSAAPAAVDQMEETPEKIAADAKAAAADFLKTKEGK